MQNAWLLGSSSAKAEDDPVQLSRVRIGSGHIVSGSL
jgi:hypothetical protein